MLTLIFAAALIQQAAGQATWSTPAPAAVVAPAPPPPPIPDTARADPWGYERAECSPLVRKADESQDACQQRVRMALAANLGDTLPEGMAPGLRAEQCRQEADGDRYALQCGAPTRSAPSVPRVEDRLCQSRPQRQANGAVVWTDVCTPAAGEARDEGLKIKLWGDDRASDAKTPPPEAGSGVFSRSEQA